MPLGFARLVATQGEMLSAMHERARAVSSSDYWEDEAFVGGVGVSGRRLQME
jgi:hypothetical protein